MPRRRRIVKLRAAPPLEYSEEVALYLTSGFDYFHALPDPIDMELMRQFWRDHRDELLPEFCALRPGRRPWAWWQFEAPESRAEDETETEYLEHRGLFLPGERELMEENVRCDETD